MKIEELINNKKIIEKLTIDGIIEATAVQEKVIPIIMGSKDVIVSSETGSGKTLAFVLPIAENIGNKLEAIVIVPTRELAKQITYVFRRYTNHKAVSIYGGTSISNQIEKLKNANIVVGTPGRLLDLLGRNKLKLDKIRFLVLDEADRMLDMGFIGDIEKILKVMSQRRQTLLFSATISKQVLKLSKKYMKDPEKILIEKRITTTKQKHKFYVISNNEKFSLLVYLLKTSEHSLVFCATKRTTGIVAIQLRKQGINADAIHGDLSQKQRETVLQNFRLKNINVLVATDVAARGLDIDDITHVYNFDLPGDGDMYVHRAGRTARMGREGEVISFVSEENYVFFSRIYKIGEIKEMEKPSFPKIPFRIEKRYRGRF